MARAAAREQAIVGQIVSRSSSVRDIVSGSARRTPAALVKRSSGPASCFQIVRDHFSVVRNDNHWCASTKSTNSSIFFRRIARILASDTCIQVAPTFLSRPFPPIIDTIVHLSQCLRVWRRVRVGETREFPQKSDPASSRRRNGPRLAVKALKPAAIVNNSAQMRGGP
jgi:hypothetical protein